MNVVEAQAAIDEASRPGTGSALRTAEEGRRFRRWYWGLVPLLAVAAYASVLRVGFLGDDLALLGQAQTRGISAHDLLPDPDRPFYRPLGVVFIWDVGAQVWGRDS